MFETLKSLLTHYGSESKAVVWAHNSHVGDAAATERWSRFVRQAAKVDPMTRRTIPTITGTRRNGPAFFGLRDSEARA